MNPYEPRPNASTITDEQLDELYRRIDRAERTITESHELLGRAVRRLERGRD